MSERRTILHLSPLAVIGGCEVNCLRVIQGSPQFEHRILVFDEVGPMSASWGREGARIEHLGMWRHGRKAFRRALLEWSGRQQPPAAIIYWSNSRLPLILKTLGHWRARWAVHLGNPLGRGFRSALRRLLYEVLYPAPAQVTLVACSQHVAKSHQDAVYYRRFAASVIYNPVDPALDLRHHHRLLPIGSRPRIGMVARLDRIKDHLTLIRALAAATTFRSDLVLEFAGDGPLREDLEQEAERLKVSDRVRFLGFKPVGPLLAQWDIYVHSTTSAEGMGTAVAEAMMAGLPCLVSDLPVMREVCGSQGALFASAGEQESFAHGIVRLIQNRVWRESLGLAAQDRARKVFGLAQTSAAYTDLVLGGAAKEAS
jgi:glycosyltransferase involved in cell wall biosynthesis